MSHHTASARAAVLDELDAQTATDRPKRLSLSLSDTVYGGLSDLAKQRKSTMTEVVRLALGLVRIAIQEAQAGNRMVVCSPDGKPIKEIVLP